MKKLLLVLALSSLFIAVLVQTVSAKCSHPVYSQDLNKSTRLCGENFVLNSGLAVSSDNVDIDCSSAVLKGSLFSKNTGIVIEDRKNVTLRDCRIVNYAVGIIVRNSSNVFLSEITFLRNFVGVKIIDSFNVSIVDGFDISLEKPIHVSNSRNNTFHYFNKKIKGDFCAYNSCGKLAQSLS